MIGWKNSEKLLNFVIKFEKISRLTARNFHFFPVVAGFFPFVSRQDTISDFVAPPMKNFPKFSDFVVTTKTYGHYKKRNFLVKNHLKTQNFLKNNGYKHNMCFGKNRAEGAKIFDF